MSRKDKPYLPLYVQDLLTDEKLIECSAEAHGVYLRLMCILHKQETYGLLCLKQKYKQISSKTEAFALLLYKQMPFSQKQIQDGLEELLEECVISIDGDSLFQKRMLADGELSILRSDIGKTGGSSVTKQYGKKGFLYWIGDGENKNKIGISVNVLNRLYRLRSDLKLKKLDIKETIEVEDMGMCEDFALDFFKDCRDGEWVILNHKEMYKKFALLKANIEAKYQANTDIEIDNDINTVLVKITTQIKSIGEIEVYVFNGCEAWQFREIEEMIKKGQREFEQIAMTKTLLNSKENFTTILQAFLDMIQSTGEYQTSSALKRHFGNWINKKNGSLELFLKECKNKTGKKEKPMVL